MALLLYKSNEMFSSTELIRKSKMIFDKVLEKEIEKAIILRDGKPSFLLMEFVKYERIMAEYEELKERVEILEDEKRSKKKLKVKQKTKEDKKLKEELEESSKKIAIPKLDYVKEIENSTNVEKVAENIVETISEIKDPETKEQIMQQIKKAREQRSKINPAVYEESTEEKEKKEQIEQEKLKKEQELEEFWD